MPRCPHCHQAGIKFLNKLISSEMMPARCFKCGKLSAINPISELLEHLLVPAWIFIGLVALYHHSWLFFFAGAILVAVAWAIATIILPSTQVNRHEFKIDL